MKKNPIPSFLKTCQNIIIQRFKFFQRIVQSIPGFFSGAYKEQQKHLDSNYTVLPMFCIQAKLTGSFLVPLILIILLGVFSYNYTSATLTRNYDAAVIQNMNTADDYFEFLFQTLEAELFPYLSDQELTRYYSGSYTVSDEQRETSYQLNKKKDKAKDILEKQTKGTKAYYKALANYLKLAQDANYSSTNIENNNNSASETYSDLNANISSMVSLNPFISNIYIFKKDQQIFSSVSSLRDPGNSSESSTIDDTTLHLYDSFCETSLGKQISNDSTQFYYTGVIPALDETLDVETSDYAFRVAHDLTVSSDSILMADISSDYVGNILNGLNLGDNSIVSLISPDGQELSVKTNSMEAAETQEEDSVVKLTYKKIFGDKKYYKDALKSEEDSGHQNVTYNKKRHLFSYRKIGDTGITLCALVPSSIIQSQTKRLGNITLILVLIFSIISLIVGSLLATSFSKAINRSIRNLNQVAKGDLTIEMHTDRRDEFALLYGNCNDMVKSMRNLILDVNKIFQSLDESVKMVESTSSTFLSTTDDIQTSLHTMEDGIQKQNTSAKECLDLMDNLFAKINNVNDNTKEISEVLDTTSQSLINDLTIIDTLNQATAQTTTITNDIIVQIEQLAAQMKNIGVIVNTINDIAEETNLLSLNASIEAAKAGDSGRGFSVVANEIRKLADQCLDSAAEISRIIHEITSSTENAVSTVKNVETAMEKQVSAVSVTEDSFQNLQQYVENLSLTLNSINESSSSMEQSGFSTLKAVENISSISKDNTTNITDVTKITETQRFTLDDLNNAAEELMQRADNLHKSLDQFKIHKS